jgi:outer membrane protein assembly factor BamD (BamD/ComL family)
LFREASQSKLENLAVTYFNYKKYANLYEIDDEIKKQKLSVLISDFSEINDYIKIFPEETNKLNKLYLTYCTNMIYLKQYINIYPSNTINAKSKILKISNTLDDFIYCAKVFPTDKKEIAEKAYNTISLSTEAKEKKYLEAFPVSGKSLVEDGYFNQIIDINSGKIYLKKYPNGKYVKDVENIIERKYFELVSKDNSLYSYKLYLESYPNGKYVKDVNKKIKMLDDNTYTNAKATNKINPLKQYITNYPKGRHIEDAKQRIKDLDGYAFAIAAKEETISAYERYIKENPKGQYIELAKSEIERVEFYNIMKKAEKENKSLKETISLLEPYIKKYPNNQYTAIALETINENSDSIFYLAEKYFNNTNYDKATQYYNYYIETFSTNSKHYKTSQNRINKCKELLKLQKLAGMTERERELFLASEWFESSQKVRGLEWNRSDLIKIRRYFGVETGLEFINDVSYQSAKEDRGGSRAVKKVCITSRGLCVHVINYSERGFMGAVAGNWDLYFDHNKNTDNLDYWTNGSRICSCKY